LYRFQDNSEILAESSELFLPRAFNAPGFPRNFVTPDGLKTGMMGLSSREKFDVIFSRVDTIQQCDIQREGHRPTAKKRALHSIARQMVCQQRL